jgi:putative sigma-54 modulation protein
MNVSYKGMKKELPAKLQEKLDVKFSKLSKLLEQKGPKEAHVVITHERHLQKAEVTMHFDGHPLVGIASDADLFTALSGALLKLEHQAVKHNAKSREKSRRSTNGRVSANGKATKAVAAKEKTAKVPELAGVVVRSASAVAQRIFRVNGHEKQKPMTLDEALLEMEEDRDYMVYRDSERQKISVLVRRKDGHFDLIES